MGCNPASDERQTESRHGTRRGAKSRRSASNFGFWDGELVGGYTFAPKYRWKGFEQNLTTGKPVTTSGGVNKDEAPANANDGWVDIGKYWGTTPAPQWWQVDLGKEYELGSVRVFPYWDGIRYYQYTVSVGPDPDHLTQVVDQCM